MEKLIEEDKKKYSQLKGINPLDFGKGNEKLSREVDIIVYGKDCRDES